jgi:hypothetical protein
MTPNAFARSLFTSYEEYRVDHLTPRTCTHRRVRDEMNACVAKSGGFLAVKEIGTSIEGRSIALVRCGHGATNVLLWSQMHGDEPTATLALMDIVSFLGGLHSPEPWVDELCSQVSLWMIPMLNPDGAERAQRHTASRIDMNRDARRRATPEAALLARMHEEISPAFAFNLHDQQIHSVGTTDVVTALALLAPPCDEERSVPLSRVRAMRVGALIVCALNQFIEGHIATYDDAFEPRAFGDAMQSWGTSTLLIESGHWPQDPDRSFIRKLNYVGILSALRSIGNGSYQDVDLEYYANLKPNGNQAYDIIIRNITLRHGEGWFHRADMGLALSAATKDGGGGEGVRVVVKEIGDLTRFVALEEVDAHGRALMGSHVDIEQTVPLARLLDDLQVYHAPRLKVD